MAGFDWPGLMRAGIAGRGLLPWEFWALTPAELVLMLGRGSGQVPLSRKGLEALAALYPDGAAAPDNGGKDDGHARPD
ncbi:rcc01693 family protein [Oceaniglobus roseus]|uniref:rcc01693 family protein n=1 Tax=Oceaniglobus roseus TaxID=1737570 RepID=UPI000C7ED9AD|nr:rcc01693 family protein [Kandeliimicrobium roseum]